jgi:F0F1-type ATP synthase assembly protein I
MFFKKHIASLWQLVLLGVVAAGFIFIKGWPGFTSVLLGGSAWFIPNLYFLGKIRQIRVTFDNQKMLKEFFYGELIKLLLSFSMVTVIFLVCNIDRISFLSGYIFMVVVSFLTSLKLGVKNV